MLVVRFDTVIQVLVFSTVCLLYFVRFFFFNDTATTEIYTLSLHDALPICQVEPTTGRFLFSLVAPQTDCEVLELGGSDRKSTRLNSSHVEISYAVFCLKKKKSTLYIWSHTIIASDSLSALAVA